MTTNDEHTGAQKTRGTPESSVTLPEFSITTCSGAACMQLCYLLECGTCDKGEQASTEHHAARCVINRAAQSV